MNEIDSTNQVQLRLAERGEAATLSELMERTFRHTFGAFNSDAELAAHCAGNYGETIQRREIDDPDVTTFVCAVGDALVAFAQVRQGKRPAEVTGTKPVEIHRIYVDASFHGKGIAHVLIEACLEEAIQRKADAVWLGVWENNPKATRFYEKYGFETVGEHVFHVGNDAQRDLVMMRAL
ncbi:GNAT family N-acetyltransferase [Luteibacter sp.]|jgi:ribosomal protein S18 acetylase RimI-like enzyme|uniref:GNAT family N-acetyltransferase n=1 Tax=Luteibacter sp. TaxID=1886636 RepID=UPI002F413034